MSPNFNALPKELQNYISQRAAEYPGLSPEELYKIEVPDVYKNDGPESVKQFFENKDISHILPRSKYPELEGDIDNIFMEDKFENMSRGSRPATELEQLQAEIDNVSDFYDKDFNEDGIVDNEVTQEKVPIFNEFGPSISQSSENLTPDSQAAEVIELGELEAITEDGILETAVGDAVVESDAFLGDVLEGAEAAAESTGILADASAEVAEGGVEIVAASAAALAGAGAVIAATAPWLLMGASVAWMGYGGYRCVKKGLGYDWTDWPNWGSGSNGTEMHAKAESMGIQGKSRVGNAYHPIDSPNTNYSTANQI